VAGLEASLAVSAVSVNSFKWRTPTPAANPGMTNSEPLNIGILTHIKHAIREPFAGGLEAFTYDITRNLRDRGHDVTLFAHPNSDCELDVVPIVAKQAHRCKAMSHEHDTLSADFIAEHHAYLDCLQRIDSFEFDVIFNNSLHYVPVTFSGMVRTPMLTVLHTPPFFEMINAVAALRGRGGSRYCTVSRANALQWADLIPDCHVIPNGIDLSAWHPQTGRNGSHAIWYGRLVADKGAHLAIDAARHAGVPIRLAGHAVDESYFANFIAPRLGKDVTYLGHLSRAELVTEIGHAAVCVVTPCWDEPFGLVVAEALACGTPVAAFARGAIPELLTPAVGVQVESGDVRALADALLTARTFDRRVCRRHAESHWGSELMTARYEALLASICRVRETA
jgi:glycosyltransferase involved in cell wall biosynthesis